jgi:DNA-directed RNA polymerase subunit F
MAREYIAQARALMTRIMAYEPLGLQSVAAARELSALEPERAAFILEALVSLARQGTGPARIVVDAVARAVLDAPPEQLSHLHRDRIQEAAQESELPTVAALFAAPNARLTVAKFVRPREDPAIAHLTLGHKKMLARTANPDLLARLAAEAEPTVVRNILVNPRLTESMVVRICARKPIKADVLRLVYASRTWSVREKVREAIVHNPYCEPELALKILPTLPRQTLQLIAKNLALHQSLREAAARLLESGKGPTPVD